MMSRPLSRLLRVAAAAVFGLCAAANTAAGAVDPDSGCTTTTMPANDDNYSGAVPIGFDIQLGAQVHTQVFISTNGHVRFTPGDSTPGAWFPLRNWETMGTPVLAPFFADVDTRGASSGLVTYGAIVFDARPALCINWVDVGYFDAHDDKRNSFQLILVDRGDQGFGSFDLIYNYDRVEWEAGDGGGAAGGVGGNAPPRVGYWDGTAGDELPGSKTGDLRDGQPLALIAGKQGSLTNGSYKYEFHNGLPLQTARIDGVVSDPNGFPAAGAIVQACATCTSLPLCESAVTDSAGHYRINSFKPTDLASCSSWEVTVSPPSSGPGFNPGFLAPTPVTVSLPTVDTVLADVDFTLNAAQELPADTTLVPSKQIPGGATPIVHWQSPLTLQTQGCASSFAMASYEIIQAGVTVQFGLMDQTPPGTYTATIPPLHPLHGAVTVKMTLVCPTGTGVYGFSLYIDPSGNVYTTEGLPVVGVQMTLYRSDYATGPFVVVPDGSAIMSPSNRANPSYTDNDGHFGWDVVGGFYLVRAEKPGCTSPVDPQVPYVETDILPVPPEWTDLVMVLDCPRLLPTVVQSVTPLPDSVGVGINAPLVIRLNKAGMVDPYTSHIALHRTGDGALVHDFPVQPAHLVDSHTLEFWPTWPLEPFTQYHVVIYRKAVRIAEAPWGYIGDYGPYPGGNALDPAMWSFTTGAGYDAAPLPRVIDGVVPLDGAMDVPVDTQLEIYLNAPVKFDAWTTHLSIRRAGDGALVEQITLGWLHLVEPGTLAVSLSAPLEPDTAYYVVFDRKAMRIDQAPWGYLGDRSGYVNGMPINPMMWSFRTQ